MKTLFKAKRRFVCVNCGWVILKGNWYHKENDGLFCEKCTENARIHSCQKCKDAWIVFEDDILGFWDSNIHYYNDKWLCSKCFAEDFKDYYISNEDQFIDLCNTMGKREFRYNYRFLKLKKATKCKYSLQCNLSTEVGFCKEVCKLACEICNKKHIIKTIHVHHKDKNRKNDSLDNLSILCPSCHKKEDLKKNPTENKDRPGARRYLDGLRRFYSVTPRAAGRNSYA